MHATERNAPSVLERGFRVLKVFGADRDELALADIARRTGLPKATAFRLANQLVELGALEKTPGGYRLGVQLFELGATVFRQRRIRDAALPFMQDLFAVSNETVHLGILDHCEVLYIEKIVGRRSGTSPTMVGTRKPLHCTGLGKAILSHAGEGVLDALIEQGLTAFTPRTITNPARLRVELDRACKDGVAYDHEEYELGVCCVASPIVDRDGTAMGALSVTGPPARFDPQRLAAAARTAALGLSRYLYGNPW